jgi:mono/diheme cytochrome c family protein
MRRAVLAAAALVTAAGLAGCGSEGTTKALPETVVGSLPKAAAIPKGDPAAGKQLYAQNGCGGCHTFTPAASKGKVGPDLDHLAADAQKANQGPLDRYTFESIKNPSGYVVPGFNAGVMPDFASLGDKKIADLVAFLTQKS